MERASGAYGGVESYIQGLVGNMKRKVRSEDLGIDRRTILKINLKQEEVGWIGLSSLRM